jgi:hypothetical protein
MSYRWRILQVVLLICALLMALAVMLAPSSAFA